MKKLLRVKSQALLRVAGRKGEKYVITIKVAVAEALKDAHYIDSCDVEEGAPRGTLHIVINSENAPARITEITKISKPGRRVYANVEEIPTVKSGRGIVLISTSKGIMTGKEAKKQHLGGEILVKVY